MERSKDTYRNKIINKILSLINHEGECWIWKKCTNTDGYGSIWAFNKGWRIHRLSYFLFIGEIPKGLLVCHTCDKPACFNPAHLWVGTHKENMEDMMRKGRTLYAEQRPNNKISTQMRPVIAKKYLSGMTMKSIAKEYNCHEATIFTAINKVLPDRKKKNLNSEGKPYTKIKIGICPNITKEYLSGTSMIDLAKKYNTSKSSIFTAIHRIIPKGKKGLRGEKHLSAKLTDKEVIIIRSLSKNGLSARKIASRYNMTQASINRVIKGKTWKHIL